MAVARLKFLDRNEIELIHTQSLRCLWEVGIAVRSEAVRSMLAEAGAEVQKGSDIVRIPESLINEAVKRAPKSFTLYARNPRYNLQLPVDGIPYVGTTGLSIHMTDIDTGEQRSATRKDCADFARLGEALEEVDFMWSMIIPRDVPHEVHTAYELWISMTNCSKHFQQIECRNAEDARMQIALGSLLAGGRENLRKRPIFSVLISPDSPLVLRKDAVEAQVELAKAGIPIISMTMPLSGLTSPVTIAGTLVIVNSENLASLVVTQLASPGNPHIYASDAVPGDMATGDVAYEAPEVPAMFAGMAQMAQRYGLPCMCGDWGLCSGSRPGIHKSFSEVSSTALDTFSGTDMISGIGSTDVAKGASLEQMVIDAYMWKNWKGFLRKFIVDEQSAALDVIKAVGHGNTFLTHPHTLKNFRKELYFRDKRTSAWEATLSDRMVPEAREVAKKILREFSPEPLDKSILREGERLISEYHKRYAG